MRCLRLLCGACLLGGLSLWAQGNVPAPAPKPAIPWAAITIHDHDPNDTNMNWGEVPNGIGLKGVDLRILLSEAYAFDEPTLRDDEITGYPAWARSARYDVVAHVAPEDEAAYKKATDLSLPETIQHMLSREPTPDMLMMRALLQERFGLRAHTESKEQRVYALLVDKGGAKLKPTADPAHGSASWSAGVIKSSAIPAPFLAMMLSVPLQRHVVDRTGLTGSFDCELHFAPMNAPPAADSRDPDLFTAVREQLGLRLESARAPEPILVIDQVHPPSPN